MPDVSFTNLLVVWPSRSSPRSSWATCHGCASRPWCWRSSAASSSGRPVLGWVHVDLPVSILALFGLAFLLFLAGLEIDVHRLRGRLLRYAVLGYLVSLGPGIRRRCVLHRDRVGVAAAAAGDRALRPPRSAWSCRCSRTPASSTVRSGRPRWRPRASPTSRPSSCCRCSSPPRAGAPARRSWCSARSRASWP